MEEIVVKLGFDKFPRKFTGDGLNTSPPLTIEGAKGKSMAIVVEDPDAPGGTWVHWVIWNIPILTEVPEGLPKYEHVERPFKAVQGRNSGDDIGYDGPYPPAGHGPHRYYFKVYVLDRIIDLQPGATLEQLMGSIKGHVVQKGEAMATYERL